MLSQNQILSDRYLLTQCLSEKIGRQTWKAIDRQTDQTVVLKVLLFGTGVQWQEIKLFEREAQLLRSLDLPQIPHYLDDFELNLPDAQGFVLVQTYLDARSLEFYLESGSTFTSTEAKEIAEQLLRLLIELHNRTVPIIHRDIKPSNILLSNRSAHSVGQLYLVDFGSAMTHELSGKGTVTIVGTFGYIPPEQFVGQTVPASDLYSLGITLISLLTGMQNDALSHSSAMDLESFTEVEVGLVRWLRKMIEPTLERRFHSAQEALEALKKSGTIELNSSKYKQPANTRIVLKKSVDQLTVQFPRNQFRLPAPIFCFILVITLGWLFLSGLNNPFWGMCFFAFNWFPVIFFLLSHQRLKITPTKIQTSRHSLGIRYYLRSSPREDVLKLERVNPQLVNLNGDGKKYTAIKPEVIVWAGTNTYRLSPSTIPEVDWLAQELSDWLEMPIESRDVPVVKI